MAKKNRLYVVGIDEAGYGPNLGPLALGASIWQVPSKIQSELLASKLEPEFQAKRLQGKDLEPFVPLGDSKELYQSGISTESLEIGVLSLLQNAKRYQSVEPSKLWPTLLEHADCLKLQPLEHKQSLPWYEPIGQSPSMPWLAKVTAFCSLAASGLSKLEVDFEGFQARLVDEMVFNQGLRDYGGKGKLLSFTSLHLVKDIVESLDLTTVDGVEIYCDRHGGRSKYLELLQAVFEEVFFWIEKETPHESSYRTEWNDCPLRIRFTVGGDRFPPTSAASMLAKWLREASMDHFNRYWQGKVSDLKPTAGYPVDAKRFVNDLKASEIWSTDNTAPKLETIWRQA